jgi:hypothetical protein
LGQVLIGGLLLVLHLCLLVLLLVLHRHLLGLLLMLHLLHMHGLPWCRSLLRLQLRHHGLSLLTHGDRVCLICMFQCLRRCLGLHPGIGGLTA